MKYIVDILTLLMLVFSFVACSSDDEVGQSLVGDDGEVTVRLILALGGDEAGITRVAADPIDEMKDGTIAENWVNDVQILVYDAAGTTFIERATIQTAPHMLTAAELEEKELDPEKVGVYYGIEGVLYDLPYRSLVNQEDFQFVVLCNLGDKNQTGNAALYTAHGYGSGIGTTEFNPAIDGHSPAVTGTVDRTIANLGYRNYTKEFTARMLATDDNNKPTGAARIPMWGFLKTTIQHNTSYTVNVLRSMAKVRVALGTGVTGYTLTGVILTHANSAGYLAAQDIPAADANSSATRQAINGTGTNWNHKDGNTTTIGITTPSPLMDTESPVLTNLPFVGVDADGKPITTGTPAAYVIYVPEYDNTGAGATPATISLSITDANGYAVKDANDNDHRLLFADYGKTDANGTAIKPTATEWDIIRNDFFDYTITSITPTGGLKANVRVMPWEYETMGYELSQHAKVEIISAPSAEFNYTNGRYTNKTIYETDNYATFIIRVKEPKGVRWNAHLSNPYFFDFTVDTQDYGYGGDEVHTIKVKPTYPYNSTKELQTTDLFFTVETLRDREVQLTYEANDVDDNDYGIAAGTRLHITQVSASAEEAGDETTPFTVASGLYDYTKRDTDLGLSQPEGIVTIQISDGKSGNGFANGVVMTEFKGNLYSMWQESAEVEDALDTHVKYASLSVATENNNKVNSNSIWSNSPSVLCNSSIIGNSGNTDIINKDIDFCSSGGWISTENQLYAFINCWETAQKTLDGGYACYRTSSDGTDWGTVTNVKMSGGGIMNGVIEQDPHVMENGRIITAAHFQQNNEGLYVSPIYTDDLTQGWKKAAFTHTTAYSYDSKTATYEVSLQSKEMEPSLFKRNNGSLVMIFRDNEQNKDAQSTYKLMASVSYDYGETWTKSVLTNMPDSRSKQCAGNLPDGTAYIVNNPVNDRNRWPLVITLSKDGFTFDTAYLLRSGTMMDKRTAWNGTDNQYPDVQDGKRSDGSWRYRGYHYPKAMVHGDYLYVSYSTNKEDVEYTRIPLSSIQLNDPSAR